MKSIFTGVNGFEEELPDGNYSELLIIADKLVQDESNVYIEGRDEKGKKTMSYFLKMQSLNGDVFYVCPELCSLDHNGDLIIEGEYSNHVPRPS